MYSVILLAALSSAPAATGHWRSHGCYGTYNAYCHGGQGYAGWSCYGSPYGYGNFSIYAPPACAGVFGCTGCYGCYGGWSCYGVALPHHGYWNECPAGEVVPQRSNQKIEETPAPREIKGKEQTRARVIIDAPANAKVYVDGQAINVATGSFRTPELVPEETYFYNIRIEIVRDGQTIAENQRVILKAGQTVTAAFRNQNQESTVRVNND